MTPQPKGRAQAAATEPATAPAQAPAPAPAQAPAQAPAPPPAPVRALTVLYDAGCPLCVHIRHWLLAQHSLVPIALVPAASYEAQRRFPHLDHASTLKEITVVGDAGQVWRGTDAFIVCLWALTDHRARAYWLATPAGRPFARAFMYSASKWREAVRTPGTPVPTVAGAQEAACDDQCSVPR
ncbi:thiol-disulfide oxidoreductase DCC family protein [Streptomyces sp. NPDC058655]|uniref:thiol-disulfide oxidoreductase DCC family protein n=1 Tax=unclassified Streptomyces TaxID=2593676 RepID=UPI003653FB24